MITPWWVASRRGQSGRTSGRSPAHLGILDHQALDRAAARHDCRGKAGFSHASTNSNTFRWFRRTLPIRSAPTPHDQSRAQSISHNLAWLSRLAAPWEALLINPSINLPWYLHRAPASNAPLGGRPQPGASWGPCLGPCDHVDLLEPSGMHFGHPWTSCTVCT